jgi:hypothetical protein
VSIRGHVLLRPPAQPLEHAILDLIPASFGMQICVDGLSVPGVFMPSMKGSRIELNQ